MKNPWLVVLGSALALTVGNGPIMQFTFGIFLKPLVDEFGITRGLASLALTVGLTTTALSLPIAGRIADRLGPRRLGLIAVFASSLGLCAVALLANSIWAFIALFALVGVFLSGQTPLPYTKAVTAVFDERRGIALALTLTGVGIGSIVLPLVAQVLVSEYGWRGGYAGIAALLVLVAVPSLLLFIPAGVTRSAPDAGTPSMAVPGLTVAEAVRTRDFWLLLCGLFLGAAAANGTIAHVVPMLTDRGVPALQAAGAMASVGLAAMVGRLVGGYLLDRFWAPLVALVFFTGMAIGIGILVQTTSPSTASAAVLLIGLGLGVEADLIGFLLTRYLGLRAYGALFGWVFGAFMLANSIGPLLMGVLYTGTGAYTLCLMLFIVCTITASILFLLLGSYRYPATKAYPVTKASSLSRVR